MFDNTYLRFAIDSLKHRRLRSWLTMLGIIVGLASIIALISLGQGLQNSVNEQFSKMGAQDLQITPGEFRGPPIGKKGLTDDDVDVVEKVRGIEYAVPQFIAVGQVEFNRQKRNANILGIPPDVADLRFEDIDVEVLDGRIIEEGDSRDAIVGYDIAYDYFDKEIYEKNKITVKGESFRVIGIFEKTGMSTIDGAVIMPMDSARELFDSEDDVNIILAHLRPGFDAEEVAEKMEHDLEKARDDENFEIYTPAQLLDQLNSIIGIIQTVLVGIASISLLVGGIGIMNTMYTSVLERTREIGVMKAIGAKNTDILVIFLFEAGLLGAVGGLIGIIIGSGIAIGIGAVASLAGYDLLLVRVDPLVVIGSLLFAFVVGCVSGAIPSWNASKQKPAESLRYE